MKALALGFAAVVSLSACNSAPNAGARSSGSLAASKDDALLYAADTDNGLLGVIDLKTNTKLAEVKVGEAPWRVAVAPDDTIFVANRGSRSVSVIRRGEWKVAAELATDIDPVGMAVTADGQTLYVVCATSSRAAEYGTLTAFDLSNLTARWSLELGDEPRGIALVDGNRAIISLYKNGEVLEVDLTAQKIATRAGTSLYQSANRSALTSTPTAGELAFHPRAVNDVIATPDGKRVFVAGSLSRETPILIPPSPIRPYYGSQGPRLAGSVTTAAVFTYDTPNGQLTPRVDDMSSFAATAGATVNRDVGFPQTSYAGDGYTDHAMQGPTVGVVDYSGEWLYLVNRETRRLTLISAKARFAEATEAFSNSTYSYRPAGAELPSVHSSAEIGSGANGVVVMGDNLTVYVYSQFDHKVTKVKFDTSRNSIGAEGTIATVGGEKLSPELVAGRKLFYDATDRRVSGRLAAVACSSCHLEGRDDGHVWNFPDGPRQTPTLAGRGTLDTAPFHWSGEFSNITDFLNHTITSRMGGTGLDGTTAVSLNRFMGALPAPENPYLKGPLTAAQVRGQHAFVKAQCDSCHSGQWFTNNAITPVQTLAPRDNGLVVTKGLNVPSLRGLARSGPYLHDGSVVTLKDRLLRNPNDKHGVTSTLTEPELDDLVEYLRAL